jgi:hypothetical protein
VNRARLDTAAGEPRAAARRNEPCPCGSGRRYKDCHGAVGTRSEAAQSAPPQLRDAVSKQRAGDFSGALAIARAIVETDPERVDARHVAGPCALECGRTDEALTGYLYGNPSLRWAEPDLDHAAHFMRRLVDDDAYRNRIAATGQRDVRARLTRATTASLIRRRLLELGAI